MLVGQTERIPTLDSGLPPVSLPDKSYHLSLPLLPEFDALSIKFGIERLLNGRVHSASVTPAGEGTVSCEFTFSVHPVHYRRNSLNSGNLRVLFQLVRNLGGSWREVPNVGRTAKQNRRGWDEDFTRLETQGL